MLRSVQWVMAELVRLFHDTDTSTAQEVVDALVDRTVPVLWKVGEITRVLDVTLSVTDQPLLLAYAEASASDKALMASLEQPRLDTTAEFSSGCMMRGWSSTTDQPARSRSRPRAFRMSRTGS